MGNFENLKPFKRGHKKVGGRKKGVPNKFPNVVMDAVLLAAEAYGRDGEGSEGLVGFCMMLLVKHPKQFLKLVSRVLVLQEKRAPTRPTSCPCRLELLTDEEFKQFGRLLVKAQVPFRPLRAANGDTRLEAVDPQVMERLSGDFESAKVTS